jgi:DNA-binding YbaB/EbfC family protein
VSDDDLPVADDEGLGPGGPDLGNLLSQAMEMQQQVMAAQAQAAETEVEGQSGGGAVRVVVTGAMEFRSVEISPAAVDPDDVEMLQDLVLAALHDAVSCVNELQEQSLGSFGDALGGSGLGGMLGLSEGDDIDDNLIEAEIDDEVDGDRGV